MVCRILLAPRQPWKRKAITYCRHSKSGIGMVHQQLLELRLSRIGLERFRFEWIRSTSGKGAVHFVSFCDMAFSTFFRIFLLLSLFIAFFILNLEKGGKRSGKGCKSRKSHAPLSFCILFQCVKIS